VLVADLVILRPPAHELMLEIDVGPAQQPHRP
jgi:hypothetical protein